MTSPRSDSSEISFGTYVFWFPGSLFAALQGLLSLWFFFSPSLSSPLLVPVWCLINILSS